MPPKKSIFRQDGARHFQLVHRSQRDPAIHDPGASAHVLKAVERENAKKGKSRAELEAALAPDERETRANEGEASLYGVYYDDTAYDYMQHLKSTGGDGVLLEAPSTKGKGKARADLELVLPPEALPSATELPRNYASEGAVPAALAGLRPDMDPHLRQALEALEDDAFVDDALADDFFGELLADGERAPEEEFAHGSDEDGFADAFAKAARIERGANADADEGEVAGWEDRFAAFKRAQAAGPTSDDEPSEGGDTVGTLPALSVLGGKRRRKGTSDASGYSMSSASMFRNAGLSALDERFERLEQEYADDADELDDEEDDEGGEGAPELITSRADFDAMMDDFLDNYEILGRQMVPVLPGATPAAKLAAYRTALADGGRLHASDDADDGDILMPTDVDAPRDRWDCETVLSTYSNLENHPRLIRARDSRPVPRIRLDPRTGLPVVDAPASAPTPKLRTKAADSSATDDGSDTDIDRPVRVTVARPRDESKEDKKARKHAAKAEKQTRRVAKKVTQARFAAEFKQQRQALASQDDRRLHVL